jgi:hypothetical protein
LRGLGFEGMSNDINGGRGGDFLHLVWKYWLYEPFWGQDTFTFLEPRPIVFFCKYCASLSLALLLLYDC